MNDGTFYCDGEYWSDLKELDQVKSPCAHLPLYKKIGGKGYCVLHYPGIGKTNAFKPALDAKLKAEDYNLRGVWFPEYTYFGRRCFQAGVDLTYAFFNDEANFEICTFEKDAFFDKVTFNADANFNGVSFNFFTSFFACSFRKSAIFHGASFGDQLIKSKVTFFESIFEGKADFSSTEFNCEAEFVSTTFNDSLLFDFASFTSNTDFNEALFKDYVSFSGEYYKRRPIEGDEKINEVFGDETSLNLQFAVFEKPERVSFHTTLLKPHWFVNTDCRKFEFTDIKWKHLAKNANSVNDEIEDLTSRRYQNLGSPFELLAIANRRLALNSEENNRYEQASSFRYLAMDTHRLEKFGGFSPYTLTWWYWLLSGYGEEWKRAFAWLLGICLFWAFLYASPLSNFADKHLYSFWYWFGYSLNIITLQRPDPKPASTLTMILTGLEVLFAPIQAALLILAVRRKFMR